MRYLIGVSLMFYLLVLPKNSGAYEPGTHRELSVKAAQQSVLGGNNGLLTDLGLKSQARRSFTSFPVRQVRA